MRTTTVRGDEDEYVNYGEAWVEDNEPDDNYPESDVNTMNEDNMDKFQNNLLTDPQLTQITSN